MIVPYRIHFTADDIARTRVADMPMPLVELGLAARALQDRSQPVRLDSWRRRSQGRLSAEARMVLSLEPPIGFSPTFITPAMTGPAGEVVKQARATPLSEVSAELATLAEVQKLPSWTRALAYDAELYQRLCDGLSDLYDALLNPYWSAICDLYVADRAVRTRHLLQGGTDRLFREANPQWMRWIPPVLQLQMPNGIDHDLYLEGYGVLLVPSVFRLYSLVDSGAYPQPIVTYPASLDRQIDRLTLFAERSSTVGDPAAAALLGATRATVLRTIVDHQGCSTKELAAMAGISCPSASEHATILRRAGLVKTARYRNTVIHTATELGAALLSAPHDSSGG